MMDLINFLTSQKISYYFDYLEFFLPQNSMNSWIQGFCLFLLIFERNFESLARFRNPKHWRAYLGHLEEGSDFVKSIRKSSFALLKD